MSLTWSQTPEDRFSHDMVQLYFWLTVHISYSHALTMALSRFELLKLVLRCSLKGPPALTTISIENILNKNKALHLGAGGGGARLRRIGGIYIIMSYGLKLQQSGVTVLCLKFAYSEVGYMLNVTYV